ncbi:hypothetical protein Tco_1416117, partial [Tanacetum coccineum]
FLLRSGFHLLGFLGSLKVCYDFMRCSIILRLCILYPCPYLGGAATPGEWLQPCRVFWIAYTSAFLFRECSDSTLSSSALSAYMLSLRCVLLGCDDLESGRMVESENYLLSATSTSKLHRCIKGDDDSSMFSMRCYRHLCKQRAKAQTANSLSGTAEVPPIVVLNTANATSAVQ